MLAEPLPTLLDARKAAQRGVTIRGVLRPAQLPGFASLLAHGGGEITVVLEFSRDDQERYVVDATIEADVTVICQRCLGPMEEHISCRGSLALVLTDQQAAALPKHLDPLLLDDQMCNLHDLAEEELILALPPFSYHEQTVCGVSLEGLSDPVEETKQARPNPFDVLGQLKLDEEH